MMAWQNPKSLFQQCLDFICDNLHCLESLTGFPESIGRKMFSSAFHCQHDPGESCASTSVCVKRNFRSTLQVFIEAYGSSGLLDSLSLCEDPFFVNDTVDDCWWLYQYLRHLDVAYCGFGDHHDVLPQLLGSTRHLQTLILRGNMLTDEGVRKLTLRKRMFQERSPSLEVLDFSENVGVTVKSLQFLKCLTNLLIVDVSSTGILRETVMRWHDATQWRVLHRQDESSTVCDCIRSKLTVATCGWGAFAVEKWRKQCEQTRQQRVKERRSRNARVGIRVEGSASTFYSKVGAKLESKTTTEFPADKCLVLVSTLHFSCPHFQKLKINGSKPFVKEDDLCARECLHRLEPFQGTNRQHAIDWSGKTFDTAEKNYRFSFLNKISCDYLVKQNGPKDTFSQNDTSTNFSRKDRQNQKKRKHSQDEKPSVLTNNTSHSVKAMEHPDARETMQSLLSQYKIHHSGSPTQTKKSKKVLLDVLENI